MREISDINLSEVIERELNDRFDKQGFIKCPFHLDHKPSLSIKFFPDKNKYKYKCFACGENGDAIDFIMNKRNVDYKTARELLGMEDEKTSRELQEDKVKGFIRKIKPSEHLKGLFTFVDAKNDPIYFKAKLVNESGNKYTPYFSISGNDVIAKRLHDEVPYNYYNLLKGIKEGKTIIFVEGEKDANTINKLLRGRKYVATSIKGCKNLEAIKTRKIKSTYVLGDTGQAGEKYIQNIKSEFQEISNIFKIIKLAGLRALGDNKDVTDWIDAGHTLEELLSALNRASNLNNKFDFYYDFGSTYKNTIKGEEVTPNLISNFVVMDGKILKYVEDENEGVKLTLKSANNNIIEKTGYSTVFDDTRSFKNFLGSMDLTFYGNMNILNDYKTWINNNYLLDTDKIYNGDRFIEINNKMSFITGVGAMRKNEIDKSTYADDSKINVLEVEPIKIEELKAIKEALLGYLSIDKTIAILGTIINDLAVYQNIETKRKLHHLLIVGESGSGKSTILEKVIAPLLNYPSGNKKTMGSTPFAILKDLCTGNYPALYDEFKPSMMHRSKLQEISDILRSLYDRGIKEKGNKIQKVYKYEYQRPIIIAGEESYPNAEKALITRSCIVYVSKAERTTENTDAIKYLMVHEKELNSLGRSIIDIIIELPVSEYDEIHKAAVGKFGELNDRPQLTACNIAVGIEIFNKLLVKYGIEPITNYEDHIKEIIQTEVLNNQSDAYSTVEQMLLLFDDMVSIGKIPFIESLIRFDGGFLYLHSSELITKLMEYSRTSDSIDITPLKINDFKKQAKLSKYIIQDPEEVVDREKGGKKTPEYIKNFKVDKKSVRMDRYDILKLKALGLLNLTDIDAFNEGVENKSNDVIMPVSNSDFENVNW